MKPRIGFLGTGWIGRHRMQAILATGAVEAAAIADPSPEMAAEAQRLAPSARLVSDLDALLATGVDGVVIATPSALHAEQSRRALERGVAVFCQKPLGRTAAETQAAVDAARRADRLLAVDLSYRFTESMRRIRDLVSTGELGRVFAADLAFHNAYGPDKPWFYDAAQSGGGCVIDLGVHLVDLAIWILDLDPLEVTSRLRGRPVEQLASAELDHVRLACSWNLHAGREAVVEASFYGTRGGVAVRNVGGSFFDFRCELLRGTTTEVLVEPPDDWSGRAAVEWARRLAAGERFDPAAGEYVRAAAIIDRIYGR
jgi:predicted dehydrogenase